MNKILFYTYQIAFEYFSGLKDIDSIKLANRKLCNGSNLIRFPILVENRDKYLEKLNSNLIEPGLWFTAPLSSPSIDHKLFKYKIGSCPTAERIADKIINLPTHNKLNNKDVNKIIGLIKTI